LQSYGTGFAASRKCGFLSESRIFLSEAVRHFPFGDGIVLWRNRGSRIYVYNASMRLLYPALLRGATIDELAATLAGCYPAAKACALGDCAVLVDHLQAEGLLESSRFAEVTDPAGADEPDLDEIQLSAFRTRINGKSVQISAKPAIAEFLRPLFPAQQACGETADIEILCRPRKGGSLIYVNGKLRAHTDNPAETAGALLEQVMRAIKPASKWLAFLHASSVKRNDASIVLAGASGSGKSTLAGFLASKGFEYLSDDIVPLIAPRGEVAACPLAINLKAGSLGLYPAPAGFESQTFPGRMGTGQLLLPPSRLWQSPPAPPRAVVFPQFVAGSSTRFSALTPLSGLARLFNDRVFLGYPLAEGRIANFLCWAEEVPFYSLEYSDLAEAAQCLMTVMG
jgi:hypothetical protein